MNLSINFIVWFLSLLIPSEKPVEIHPCSDQIFVEVRAIMPNCNGLDGQIIFTNPPPDTANFYWSHDPTETGHNVADLTAGIYDITVTVGDQVRLVTVYLE